MRHNLEYEEVKKLIDIGVPKTKIAVRFNVTIEQLRYFLRQKKNAS